MTLKEHKDVRKQAANRLRIAQGQLNTVLKMVEEDTYCIDIINQSRAVQNALREINYLLLENHLQTCVVDFIKEGKAKRAIEEIMTVVKSNNKR